MSHFAPPRPIRPPVSGVRVDREGGNGTNRNVVLTFLFDFYTHNKHRFATKHNAAARRQTERSEEAAYAVASAA